MGRYKKDISHVVSQEETQKMIEKARLPRDRFLISILYLTGARPSEILEFKREDVDIQETQLVFRLVTKKLGKARGFTIKERLLEIQKTAPFIEHIIEYLKITDGKLLNINDSRIRQIVYELSENRFCPYHFRHSRLTKLSRGGASLDELMFWKGSKDEKSVIEYLKAKPIGRKLKID